MDIRIRNSRHGQVLYMGSFLLLICIATVVFKMKMFTSDQNGWIDACFTATSSVCVSGLTTLDVSRFPFAGQLFLMIFSEIGAYGMMALGSFIAVMLGRKLSYSDEQMMSSAFDDFSGYKIKKLLVQTFFYMFGCELLGAAVMFFAGGRDVTVWNAIMISIAGFCNAGFSPFQNSLASTNKIVQLTAAVLNILGGIGVYVVYDMVGKVKNPGRILGVHTKLVLRCTLILLVAGTVLIKNGGMADGSEISWFDAFFLSSSARTAGLTTFGIEQLSGYAMFILMVLMLIGGSPGSTAGGMKTTTIGLVCVALRNTIWGNRDVVLCNRSIAPEMVLRAFSIIVIFLTFSFCCIFAMNALNKSAEFHKNAFTVISALTTTGFSVIDLGKLSGKAKMFVIFMMYVGRIGPFTLMLFLLRKDRHGRHRCRMERVFIG